MAFDFERELGKLPDRFKCAGLEFVCYGATSDPYAFYTCYDVPDEIFELQIDLERHVVELARWSDEYDGWVGLAGTTCRDNAAIPHQIEVLGKCQAMKEYAV